MKEVTPPSAAALLSLSMVALWVFPGSLKWTWSSITPGMMCIPAASVIFSQGTLLSSSSMYLLYDSILSYFSDNMIFPILSPSIKMLPSDEEPSFTIMPFLISLFISNALFTRFDSAESHLYYSPECLSEYAGAHL